MPRAGANSDGYAVEANQITVGKRVLTFEKVDGGLDVHLTCGGETVTRRTELDRIKSGHANGGGDLSITFDKDVVIFAGFGGVPELRIPKADVIAAAEHDASGSAEPS